MANVIVILILLVLVGAAVHSLIKAKKRGVKCIGCPSGGGACSCGCHTKKE